MKTIMLREEWLKKLLPGGFPYPSSTLISGPGGTGKPLVELAFVASWLENGGSTVGIPLQYPTTDFVDTALEKMYNIHPQDYKDRMAYMMFDPHIETYEKINEHTIKANLLKPSVWKSAILEAEKLVKNSSLGTLVFGSALNLLLFSPTYKEDILKGLEGIIRSDKDRTYILSVSTSAFAEEIKNWENAADNLMFTRMEKPMRLFFRIARMKDVKFVSDEVEVPVSKEALMEVKNIAEATRNRIIPELSKI